MEGFVKTIELFSLPFEMKLTSAIEILQEILLGRFVINEQQTTLLRTYVTVQHTGINSQLTFQYSCLKPVLHSKLCYSPGFF